VAALIDTHLHLYRDEFADDREATRERARQAGVAGLVHVGFDTVTNRLAQVTAAGDDAAWATAGVHPHEAEHYEPAIEDWIRQHVDTVIAIGECGLDYYRDLSPRDAQHRAFAAQIALAEELDRPMVFHVRDAYDDARAVLLEAGLPPRRGIFHAFAGDREFAHWAVGEGFKLGIGGVFTYRKAHLPEAIEGLPADALQLETDAPWLPPQPWRGRRNEPSYARHTAARVAESLGEDLDHVAAVWAREFERLFRVELPSWFHEVEPSAFPEPEPARRKKK
jgi:TatD DNase family protein